MRAIFIEVFLWLSLWAAWIWISRFNHPSLLVDAEATAIMLAGSACLFYLLQRLRHLGFATVATAAIAGIATIPVTLIVVFAIQAVYDAQVGPNPLRFGLTTNIELDWTFVVVNAAVATAASWFAGRGCAPR